MAKVQNHVENTVDNLRDSAGNVHEINAAYLNGKGAEKYATTDALPTQATSTKLGLVKSSTTGTAANRDYNVQVNSDGTMKVNVPWTDTNTSHSHSAGVGLVGSGSAGTSGTYTYKAKLRSETALRVDSAAATTSGNVYPVAVDKSGYLSLNVPLGGFVDVLKGLTGRTKVEWNALNAGEYGSNSTYNGETLPPVILESNSAFWNSASGRPLDISFHFTKKEKITTLQVKCPPYGGANPTMTVYYAQNGDAGLTLYKEIATISTAGKITYEFNKEGISADYWVVRFTSSGWIDLRLCSPIGLFTTGLYTKECYQQIMDRVNGSTSVGNYQPKGNYVTTDTTQSISGQKTFDTTPILSKIKGTKVVGTDANGLIEAHTLGISDITDLRAELNNKMPIEYYNLSYGIFCRDPNGFQYTGIDGDYRERRMFVTFDNATPRTTDPDIGYKRTNLGTVMSAGINDNDLKDYGGAIFANVISQNYSSGANKDLLLGANQSAYIKFMDMHGNRIPGGLGCLDGVAKGSLFTSRIDSNANKIFTSALMFKPNPQTNDRDLQSTSAVVSHKMPCFSIYNGIQVTTSGAMYIPDDVIDQMKGGNQYNVAFLAYSKTGQNVDIDQLASLINAASKKPKIGKSEVITVTIGTTKKITHTANQDIIYEGYITYQGNGNCPVDISLQRTSDTETSVISQWSSDLGSTECTVDVHYHRVTY